MKLLEGHAKSNVLMSTNYIFGNLNGTTLALKSPQGCPRGRSKKQDANKVGIWRKVWANRAYWGSGNEYVQALFIIIVADIRLTLVWGRVCTDFRHDVVFSLDMNSVLFAFGQFCENMHGALARTRSLGVRRFMFLCCSISIPRLACMFRRLWTDTCVIIVLYIWETCLLQSCENIRWWNWHGKRAPPITHGSNLWFPGQVPGGG